MRLHRLEVEGFGPFRSRQVVDFDAFADDGIFLIAGRTGAGKSSILDAVCFALYGGVPRYDGGEKRLRSDHCEPDDPSEVVVEFSTPSGRYRVRRSPEYLRPAKRGGGMTKQASAVGLEELTDDGWVGRAARAVDVAHELDEILQLSREQFLQVILLAQNRFSEFLLANSRDRQALLRRLFGSERFDDVQTRFDERRRASEQAIGLRAAAVTARLDEAERLVVDEALDGVTGAGEEQLVTDAGDPTTAALSSAWSDAPVGGGRETPVGEGPSARAAADPETRLALLRRAEARAAYRAERRAAEQEEAELRLAEADTALLSAREQRGAQVERDRARSALADLDAQQDEIDAARILLDRARAAEALRGPIDERRRASAAVESAESVVADAVAAWDQVADEGVETSIESLQGWVAARTAESGAWQQAAQLEALAADRAARLSEDRAAVERAAARVAAIEKEQAESPAALAALREARDDARRLADRVDDLTARRDRAAARCDAARDEERLRRAKADADRELATASTALATAQAELAALRQRRLDGFAGELASTLVPGEACPVCGAHEHPVPAAHVDPVSADDVDDAEALRDAAARHERGVAERVSAVQAELAVAVAAADGRTPSIADAECEALDGELRAAVEARETAGRLDGEIAAFADREADLAAQRADAARESAAARESLAAREQSDREAGAQIERARGGHPSVAQRIEAMEVRIAAAAALAGALLDRDRRLVAVREAEEACRRALEDSPFEEISDAERALLPSREQGELDARITRHTVLREKEKGILLPLELRALPEEPIAVAPVEERAAAARSAWMAAVDAAGKARTVVERLGGLIASAAEEHARSAADVAEHAVLQNLADTLAGRGPNTRRMTLETFVLAAELEEIVAAANRRLDDMSSGRYRLQHSDAVAARGAASGLGIVVFDAFTGQTRPAQSLSGGETFLGSLALALGLAEVVTARAGGIRLDTLFIDEGFGSLDGDTLEVAMRTLDELRQGGRTVGVISHVEAMQDQIPAQLRVFATEEGPSLIETR
ncbi:AAA family ATPase [Microbacterium sp. 179-I 3D4 NHS]|uniref:AAA family ATPase n=1 Tax=Microbacterium sp. 179-I 3D4 NHS TaxID=3142381 RepID=UPI0039A35BFE